VESCSGYSACQFRSSYSSLFSITDAAALARKPQPKPPRKTGVYVALWAFISLLIGAFSASYMATVGGRVRDDLPMAG
jgi:hypothetical protein